MMRSAEMLIRNRLTDAPTRLRDQVTSDSRHRMTSAMLQIYDLCLAALILLVPLTMAGVREFGVAMILLCSLIMGATWAMQQILQRTSTTRISGMEFIAIAAIGLVCLQLTHLPENALMHLSPFSHQVLNADPVAGMAIDGTAPRWNQISMAPEQTRSGLMLLVAYAIISLTLAHRLKSAADIDRVMKMIGTAAALMAVVGVGQLFFGNGLFLWTFEHPYREATWPARGTFPNENHFAHFLTLGIGPLVWWWHHIDTSIENCQTTHARSKFSAIQYFVVSAVAVVIFAALLSFSRGGIAVLAGVLLLILAAFATQRRLLLRLTLPGVLFATLGMVVFGTESLAKEWETISSAETVNEVIGGRRLLWLADLKAVGSFWPAGSGLGSHAEVYPTWLPFESETRFSHAECGYLQVLLELGVPGMILLIGSMALIGRWCWKAWRQSDSGVRYQAAAISVSLLASLSHSLVDFVWYIPACMMLTLVLIVCACRCYQLSHQSPDAASIMNSKSGTVLAWLVLICIVPVGNLFADSASKTTDAAQHWHRYVKHSTQSARKTHFGSSQALDDELNLLISEMEECLRINRRDISALSNLGPLYLRRAELSLLKSQNPMALSQIRDTAYSVGFNSPGELREWLVRAFPDSAPDFYRAFAAARLSMSGQPLRGESVVVLAELGFLAGQSNEVRKSLINQAQALRPNSPVIAYVAGAIHAEEGNDDSAFECWRRAGEISPEVLRRLIEQLSPQYSAVELTERLGLRQQALIQLFDAYRAQGNDEQQQSAAQIFARRFAAAVKQTQPNEATYWTRSADVFSYLNRNDLVIACLEEALRLQGNNGSLRRRLAETLMKENQFEAALKQLKWCRIRTPDDTEIGKLIGIVESSLTSPAARTVQQTKSDPSVLKQ